MKFDVYQEVTSQILAQLENGAAPWVKPWRSIPGAGIPCNASNNRPYSGGNVFLLSIIQHMRGYQTGRWLTLKQANAAGGKVRKGEKSTMVIFMSPAAKREEGKETTFYSIAKSYPVFNIDQCEGLPDAVIKGEPKRALTPVERNEWAEAFIAATAAKISEGGEAYWRPSTDEIVIPTINAFKTADHYYATLFHELGHWTGGKERLNRDMKNRFGDKAYAAEELVAELTSAFLCAEFGLDGDLRHAGYIGNWIELLRNDKRAFYTAASRAQKAADYLRGLAIAEPLAEAA